MREQAIDFLTGLAQAVSAMTLYEEGHPARERAIDNAYERVLLLQEVNPTPVFTFLGRDIVLDGLPVKGLKRWDWGQRLAAAGIQRLEFAGPVTRDDLEVFLEDAFSRLSGEGVDTAEVRQTRPTQIRYGSVGIGEQEDDEGTDLATATLSFTLREEVEAVEWIHDELKSGGGLQLLEAETIVRSLSVAMHGDQDFLIPMLKLKRFDQYTTTHAMNVSVLAMALAEFIGLGPREIRSFGISGLLHDLGKVIVPEEILNKPGKLTDEERIIMTQHTVEGARIIIETEEQLDLAAVVAYEHHIMLNGGGYPNLKYPRTCHQASNIVHVCDVFDALRTDRPYRDAMPTSRAISIIEEGAGTEFVPDLARAFIRMIHQWEGRIAYLRREDEALPIGRIDTSESPSENGGGGDPVVDESESPIGETSGDSAGDE
jgi:putative nucleotidyltransferase with HDIG domain